MSNALFAWENAVLSGAVSASAEASGLGAGQLQNPHGATSTAWQTPVGTTAAWLLVDAGANAIWRALSLHRTNLQPAATLRWRLGSADGVIERVASFTLRPRPGFTPPAGWTFTRASTAWALDGAGALQSFANDIPRYAFDTAGQATGLLIEAARTNRLLWSRDLTNAAWVKTNATAALTATGITGVASSASVITAAAANGTALQTITLASGARVASLFLRRRTGTGGVDITLDGGTTWTPVTLTSVFQRFSVTATVTNPNVGIRIQTNADAVDVDVAQLEDGSVVTTPIITTTATVTRAADDLVVTGAGVGAVGTMYVETIGTAGTLLTRVRDAGGTNDVQARSFNGSLADVRVTQGGSLVLDGADQAIAASPVRMAVTWSATAATGWLAGTQIGTYAGAIAAMDRIQASTAANAGVLSEIRIYATPLSAGSAVVLTGAGAGASTLDPAALVYDSGVVASGVLAGYGQSVTILPADQTARYARVDISDPTNPELVLRVAQMYAGPIRVPARNFSPRATAFGRAADIGIPATRGGQEFPELRFVRRGWRVAWPFITEAEHWTLIQEMARITEDGRNLLFVPLPSSAQMNRDAVFGRLAERGEIPWAGTSATLRAWSATITERL
jgi:hypothetical protein